MNLVCADGKSVGKRPFPGAGSSFARKIYPAGYEKELSGTAEKFCRFCFLKEKLRFIKETFERRNFYNADDELKARIKACSEQLKHYSLDVEKIFHAFRDQFKEPAKGIKNLSAEIDKQIAKILDELKPQEKWANSQEILLPEKPAPLNFHINIKDALRFGAVVNNFNFEGFPAWKKLGLDFVSINRVPGLGPPGGSQAKPDFKVIHDLVIQSGKFGYKSVIGMERTGSLDFSIWDEKVCFKWKTYFRLLGETFKDEQAVLGYKVFDESLKKSFNRMSWPNGKAARKSFQKFLRNKYVTIDTLNNAWETNLSGFDNIAGPKAKTGFNSSMRDFKLFVRKSLTMFLDDCKGVLKRTDKVHPVIDMPSEFGGKLDPFFLRGKRLWYEKFVFNLPGTRKGHKPQVLSAALNRDFWCALGRGFTAIEFEGVGDKGEGAGGKGEGAGDKGEAGSMSLLDEECNFGIIRPESGRIPVAIGIARRIGKILLNTHLVKAEIGIVDSPSTGIFPFTAKKQEQVEGRVEEFLFRNQWSYSFLPEAGLAGNPEVLNHFLAVVLPGNVYLESSAAERIKRFTAEGGLLIGIESGGFLDELGMPNVLSKALLARKRRLGRGYVFCIRDRESEFASLERFIKTAFKRPRLVISPAGSVQYFLRTDGRRTYLILVNLSTCDNVTCKVSLKLKVSSIKDLIANADVKIYKKGGAKEFSIRLSPGGFTMLELKKD